MTEPDHDRCVEAARFQRIDDAFRRGDIDALRAAVPDASAIPNGLLPDTIGSCLVYGIYHSPLIFIRTLLDLGADPNAPVGDGFPPLIAAISKSRDAPGTARRDDVDGLCGCFSRAARTRTSAASTTGRRCTWP
jgi:hypothetical protein